MVMKASSTLVAFLADVSRKGMLAEANLGLLHYGEAESYLTKVLSSEH